LEAIYAAGVPVVALESESNWAFFLQEADSVLLGGPPFEIESISYEQKLSLHAIIAVLGERAQGDLLRILESHNGPN
jgi:hypothetical protein